MDQLKGQFKDFHFAIAGRTGPYGNKSFTEQVYARLLPPQPMWADCHNWEQCGYNECSFFYYGDDRK